MRGCLGAEKRLTTQRRRAGAGIQFRAIGITKTRGRNTLRRFLETDLFFYPQGPSGRLRSRGDAAFPRPLSEQRLLAQDSAEAEDLVQEVYLEAWKQFHRARAGHDSLCDYDPEHGEQLPNGTALRSGATAVSPCMRLILRAWTPQDSSQKSIGGLWSLTSAGTQPYRLRASLLLR